MFFVRRLTKIVILLLSKFLPINDKFSYQAKKCVRSHLACNKSGSVCQQKRHRYRLVSKISLIYLKKIYSILIMVGFAG